MSLHQSTFIDSRNVPPNQLCLVWPPLTDLQGNRLTDLRVEPRPIIKLFHLDTGRAAGGHVERKHGTGVACFLGDITQSGSLVRFAAVSAAFGQNALVTVQQMEDADPFRGQAEEDRAGAFDEVFGHVLRGWKFGNGHDDEFLRLGFSLPRRYCLSCSNGQGRMQCKTRNMQQRGGRGEGCKSYRTLCNRHRAVSAPSREYQYPSSQPETDSYCSHRLGTSVPRREDEKIVELVRPDRIC